jgi:hypothetical protein
VTRKPALEKVSRTAERPDEIFPFPEVGLYIKSRVFTAVLLKCMI